MTIFANNQATPPACTKSRIQRLFAAALLTLSLCTGVAQADTNRIIHIALDFDHLNFNHVKSLDINSNEIQNNLFETLVHATATGEFTAGLAKQWDVSADRTTYRFEIREDAAWSDGTAITASSVAEGLQMLAGLNALPKDPEGNMPEVTVDEMGWVTLRFSTSYFGALQEFSRVRTAPPPVHAIDASLYEDDWMLSPPDAMVYSGAYKVASTDDEILSLRPNEGYYDLASLKNGGVDIPVRPPDIPMMFGQFRNRQSDMVVIKGAIQSHVLASLEPEEHLQIDNNSLTFVMLNATASPLDDVRVRRAIAYATETASSLSLEESYFHQAQPFFTLKSFEPGFDAVKPYWEEWSTDRRLEEARSLMAELGYSADNPLKIQLSDSMVPGVSINIDRVLRSQWSRIFIDAEIIDRELDAHMTAFIEGDFQTSTISWFFSEQSPFSLYDVFRSDSPYNVTGYSNQTYDELVRRWLTIDNIAERNELSAEIQRFLYQDVPALPLYTGQDVILRQKGLRIMPEGDRFNLTLRHIGYVEDTRG